MWLCNLKMVYNGNIFLIYFSIPIEWLQTVEECQRELPGLQATWKTITKAAWAKAIRVHDKCHLFYLLKTSEVSQELIYVNHLSSKYKVKSASSFPIHRLLRLLRKINSASIPLLRQLLRLLCKINSNRIPLLRQLLRLLRKINSASIPLLRQLLRLLCKINSSSIPLLRRLLRLLCKINSASIISLNLSEPHLQLRISKSSNGLQNISKLCHLCQHRSRKKNFMNHQRHATLQIHRIMRPNRILKWRTISHPQIRLNWMQRVMYQHGERGCILHRT